MELAWTGLGGKKEVLINGALGESPLDRFLAPSRRSYDANYLTFITSRRADDRRRSLLPWNMEEREVVATRQKGNRTIIATINQVGREYLAASIRLLACVSVARVGDLRPVSRHSCSPFERRRNKEGKLMAGSSPLSGRDLTEDELLFSVTSAKRRLTLITGTRDGE